MRTESMPAGIAFKTEKPDHRGGFTLVELLVVIMIIALLAAIVTPAVMRAMASSRAAAVKSEIEMLHMALMNYKNEYGAFPPADMRGLWNGTSVNTSHAAYKHLKRIFPRISEVESNDLPSNGNRSPYYFMAQMSPPQALVFWLQGFYENPQYPLTDGAVLSVGVPRAGTANANRRKLFDFDESRLFAATAYWSLVAPYDPLRLVDQPQELPGYQRFYVRNAAPTPFAREYPVYFPSQPNAGLPYVYFPNSSYSTSPDTAITASIGPNQSPDIYFTAESLNGGNSAVAPYFFSTPCCSNPTGSSWQQLHMNADTFQLIAAGADGTYGTLTASFPGDVVPNGSSFLAFPYPKRTQPTVMLRHGPFISPKNNEGHGDNITNFANGPLKSAAEKMSQ